MTLMNKTEGNKTYNDLSVKESHHYLKSFSSKYLTVLNRNFGFFLRLKLNGYNWFSMNIDDIDVNDIDMRYSKIKYSMNELLIPWNIKYLLDVLFSKSIKYEGLFRHNSNSKRLKALDNDLNLLLNSSHDKYNDIMNNIVSNYSDIDLIEKYKKILRSFNTSIFSSKLEKYIFLIDKINNEEEKLICCKAIFYKLGIKSRHIIENCVKLCFILLNDIEVNGIKKNTLDIDGICIVIMPCLFQGYNNTLEIKEPSVYINFLKFLFKNFENIISLEEDLLNY